MDEVPAIIRRWQDPGTWQTVQALTTQAAGLDSQAVKLGNDARFLLDRGDIGQAVPLKAEADHLRNCAANVLRQRAALADQFMQIERWVRDHRPELLEFVPTAIFDGDCSEAIRDLKRLESRLREPATAERNVKRRKKPRMTQPEVAAHWQEVMAGDDRDLIAEYLTLGEVELAKKSAVLGTHGGLLKSSNNVTSPCGNSIGRTVDCSNWLFKLFISI